MTYVYWTLGVLTVVMFFMLLNQMLYLENSVVYRLYLIDRSFYNKFMTSYCIIMFLLTLAMIKYKHHITAGLIAADIAIALVFFGLYVRIIEMDVQNRLAGITSPDLDEQKT